MVSNMLRVLNVAEKNDVAKSVMAILSNGTSRMVSVSFGVQIVAVKPNLKKINLSTSVMGLHNSIKFTNVKHKSSINVAQ